MAERVLRCLLVGWTLCLASFSGASPEAVLKEYVDSQLYEMERIKHAVGLEPVDLCNDFLAAARAHKWNDATNSFAVLCAEHCDNVMRPAPEVKNELWQPALELNGVISEFQKWNPEMLEYYANELTRGISEKSVLICGTDSVYHIARAYSVKHSYVAIAQSILGGPLYRDYIRNDKRNKGLKMPSESAVVRILGEARVQAKKIKGRNNLSALYQGMLSKETVAVNNGGWAFYAEQAYMAPWMISRVEPAGFLYRLNSEPIQLSKEVMEKDLVGWATVIEGLNSREDFKSCPEAQRTFGKMREAVGGLYRTFRHEKLAEQAYQQAIELDPEQQNAYWQLAGMLDLQGRKQEALEIFESYVKKHPERTNAQPYLSRLKNGEPFYANYVPPNSVDQLKQKAGKGDVEAMVSLAIQYNRGLSGTTKNPEEAAKWFRLAAEKGHAGAQIGLARLYDKGSGVEKDVEQAFKWRKMAAEQGDPQAQCGLAGVYEKGTGVGADARKAFEWRMKAAGQNYPPAFHAVGKCYENGKGVDKDPEKAFQWYMKGAKLGNKFCLADVGKYYEKGIGTDRDPIKAYAFSVCSGMNVTKRRIKQLETELSPEELAAAKELSKKIRSSIKKPQ